MLFSENKKKNYILFFCAILLVASGIFFVVYSFASAQELGSQKPDFHRDFCLNNKTNVWCLKDNFENIVVTGFKWLLYYVLQIISLFTFVAIVIFNYVLDPDNISGKSGLLNLQAVYEMWQFIRDFFNLFFILVLLYIAFTVVFQIQKNFKQALLSLIIAALLVNFSFPISRFVIDVTNVPMYFFANQLVTSNKKNNVGDALGETLTVSGLQEVLLPKRDSKGKVDMQHTLVSELLLAIIFVFMFSITLLVLAIMFVIRLIALIILVIFSSAGFAAAIIPGMDKYSKMWWDNFWKYALFGPAATLMLLIAIRFFVVIGGYNGATYNNIYKNANNIGNPSLLASMVIFSVPMIMLWFAIGLGQTMALAGGATISGYGHKFAAWAGKKMTYKNALVGGIGGGIKQRWDQRTGVRIPGTRMRMFGPNAEKDIKTKVASMLGVKGARIQSIKSEAEEKKKKHFSVDDLNKQVDSGDVSAALLLAQQGDLDHDRYMKIKPYIDGDKAVKDLIEGEIKKKRVDVLIKAEIESLGPGATSAQQQQAAEKHIKKLNPSDWKNQNLEKLFRYYDAAHPDGVEVHVDAVTGNVVDAAGTIYTGAEADRAKADIEGAKAIYGRYTSKNKDKTVDDMSGEKYIAGQDAGVW